MTKMSHTRQNMKETTKTRTIAAAKGLLKLGMLLVLIVAVMSFFNLYNYQAEHPEVEYQAAVYSELPQEAQVKMKMINEVRTYLLWGVALAVAFMVLEYYQDPKDHWATTLMKKFREVEDD